MAPRAGSRSVTAMLTEVTTYWLEMHSPAAHSPVPKPQSSLALTQAHHPSPEFSRFLYTAVGGDWCWTDRLPWTYAQWMKWLQRPEVETWVLYVSGTPAGYFELEAQAGSGHKVNLAYFGLVRGFIGRGLGRYLLSQAIGRGWAMRRETEKLCVNTCTLDHPKALANYLERGFCLVEQKTVVQAVPEPPGPWPNAQGERQT